MYSSLTIKPEKLKALQEEMKKFPSIRFEGNPVKISPNLYIVYVYGNVNEVSTLINNVDIFSKEPDPIPQKKSWWKRFTNRIPFL